MCHRTPVRAVTTRRLLTFAALITCATSIAFAADWPVFKPGNWSFERTMSGSGATPRQLSRTECTDPTEDQKKQHDMLAKAGCQFSPLAQSGNTYRYSASCKMGDRTTRSDSVLQVESDRAFTITVDAEVGGEKTHEVLKARRIGDCSK